MCAKRFLKFELPLEKDVLIFFLLGDDVQKQIQEIIDELQNIKTQSRSNERRSCMTQLIRLTRDGNCVVIKEKFRYVLHKKIQEKKYHNFIFFSRDVLRLLLENLSDEVGSTRALVFGVLTEMLKQEPLISSFQGFTELIILKVLEAHRDDEKDVRSLIFRLFF